MKKSSKPIPGERSNQSPLFRRMLADHAKVSAEIEQSDWPKICVKLASKGLTKPDGTPLDPTYVRKTWTKVCARVAKLDAQVARPVEPVAVAPEQVEIASAPEPASCDWVDPRIAATAEIQASLSPAELISQAEIIAFIEAQDAHAVLIDAQAAQDEADEEARQAAAGEARQAREEACQAAIEIGRSNRSADLVRPNAAPVSRTSLFGRLRSALLARPSRLNEKPAEFQPARIRSGGLQTEHAAVRDREMERAVWESVEAAGRMARGR